MTWSAVVPTNDPWNAVDALKALVKTHAPIPASRIVVVYDWDDVNCSANFWPEVHWVKQGPPPFVMSREWNRGLREVSQNSNVILLEDDVEVLTPNAFDILDDWSEKTDGKILLTPAIEGDTFGHPEIQPTQYNDFHTGLAEFPFICPFIPRRILDAVGPFDESFTGYGKDDYDYCLRARQKGFQLGVVPWVRVRHHISRSAYRKRRDFGELLKYNHDRFAEKWGFRSP